MSFDEMLEDDDEPSLPETEWDPEPDERTYYRDTATGNLGYHVVRAGRDMVRLDRPNEEVLAPLDTIRWQVEREHRPLTMASMAQVCFAADQQLLLALGIHDGKREWLSLTDRERIKFIRHGPPPDPPIRTVLYRRMKTLLEKIAK